MNFLKQIDYHPQVADQIKESLKTNKIVLLQNCREENLFDFYESLSNEIGHWVPIDEDLETGNKTGNKWIEIRYDERLAKSFRYSNTRQPMHTDGSYERISPNITFFFCIEQATIGGATTFFNYDDLIETLELYSKDLLDRCRNIPMTFAKGDDSKTRPIIQDEQLTWNYFPAKANNQEEMDLKEDFHNFLEQKVVGGGLCTPINLKPGDAVFFHDEKLLHGRNSFIGNRNLLKGGLDLSF